VCAEAQPYLRFIDSTQRPGDLAGCGLRREHLEGRVYLRDSRGRLVSGMPALIALWSKIPSYRRLARVLNMPVLRQLSALMYDHVIAPSLALWARRRSRHAAMLHTQARPHRRVTWW
jgi:predicted DCC family thiol-disulfide oxidoreductase YuxK